MSNTKSTISFSFPWLTVLTVFLAIAKVTGHTAISWFIVFLPMLIPFFVLIGIFAVVAVCFIIGLIIAAAVSA